MTDFPSRVRQAFIDACLGELAALKPGNVHAFADGHGMTVHDFRKSAEMSAEGLGRPGLSVGDRILAAMVATHSAVGCNTNLGIILLCAPLAHAALAGHVGAALRPGVGQVLAALDVEDAERAYKAIRKAAPSGLGISARFDVRERPSVTLLEAMSEAQDRDLIARQYANGYADVFDVALPRLLDALARGYSAPWATTAVYLEILGRYPDSHVARSLGREAAEDLRSEGAALDEALRRCPVPDDMHAALMDFDTALKKRNINPGTSADLTVAALFAWRLSGGGVSDGG